MVVLPSRGVAEVISSDRGRRLRSESRMESRNVRMASSNAAAWSLWRPDFTRAHDSRCCCVATGSSRSRQDFTTGSEPRTSVFRPCWICSGSRTVLSRTSASTAAPTASRVEKRNASVRVQRQTREDRLQRRPGGIGQADGAVLEAGVDAGFLDLAHQFVVEALVGFGFLLEGLVLEGAGVEVVELGLDLGHGLLEHVFAIDGFLVLQADALRDVGLQGRELAFQLGDLGEGLLVLGVVGAVLRS